MELSDIKGKVAIAIACFRSNDSKLMDFDNLYLPERPMSHRLGFYMHILFPEYDVDCEYNKHIEGAKEEGIPDIVVHKRKVDTSNLLIVEVKARRTRDELKHPRDRSDLSAVYHKLREWTRSDGALKYNYGVSILVLSNETILEWFQDGRELQSLLVREGQTS